MTEAAAVVPVEAIPAEGLSGTHISLHLARFSLKITLLEIFAQGKIKGKIDTIFFLYNLNTILETFHVIKKIKNKTPVVHRVEFWAQIVPF